MSHVKNVVGVRVPYSQTELRVASAITGRFTSTTDIIAAVYPDPKERNFFVRQSINSVIRSLVRKIEYNDEDWEIERTEPSGRLPMKVRWRKRFATRRSRSQSVNTRTSA